ncbi:MAG: hypothetical protein JWM80_1403 [Cyanobacteria bacterium RYN_339]|nr:hypothetical protein [Cyanobacteria bacterium RYN_339]
MYEWLACRLPRTWAIVLAAAWYVLLASAIFLKWAKDASPFLYIR